MSNDFKAFAVGGGANAVSAAAWAALTALLANGFQAGVARSEQVNTVLRQATTMSAAIGEFISGRGYNAVDDGNIANLVTAFSNAVMNLVNANIVTVPSGMVLALARTTVPSGYLKANGAAVSRTTYANLFGAISTTFGAGDGATTFNTPDVRGIFVRGYHDGDNRDPDYLTRAFGSYQADMLGAHGHRLLSDASGSGPSGGVTSLNGGDYGVGGAARTTGYLTTNGGGAALIEQSGGAETRGKNIALLYVIKT